MHKKRKQRVIFIVVLLLGFSCATALVLYAMKQNIMLFHTPSEIVLGKVPVEKLFRVGGLVVKGSVVKGNDGLTTEFNLTDATEIVTIRYIGLLPDLFREGQGIVAQGKLNKEGIFVAQEVLAKHDENYMPPDVASALRESGSSHPENIPKGSY